MKLKTKIAVVVTATALAACGVQEPLTNYQPVVDMQGVNPVKYQADLQACNNIGLQVESRYNERARQEANAALGNMLIGAAVGAAIGSAVGDGGRYQGEWTRAGAVGGAAAGLDSLDEYTRERVKYGPRRVIDRCMHNRGYKVLNDLGWG
ncbi:MAG: glycine zipper family protein [Rhodobacteraceae bacterium]|nr:glycine zipper family protein [Paracoccaceae bacterium]